MTVDSGRARRAVAGDRRGVVTGAERERLRCSLAAVLAHERGARSLTQVALASAAGVSRRSVEELERGAQRPSVTMVWRLARALRAGFDDHAVGALAMRLEAAAGDSLRDYSRRPHRRRERIRAELLAESGGRPPITEADALGPLVVAAFTAPRSRPDRQGAEGER